MSPPFGRPELTTSLLVPSGAIAQMVPLSSSGAIRSRAKWPKLGGTTARPPSSTGAEFVTTWTARVQSMATTSVLPLTAPVTSRRWSNAPVVSKAIPFRLGRLVLVNEPVWLPVLSTRVMPIGVCSRRMKTSSRTKSQPPAATCWPGATARDASAPPSAPEPPGPPPKGSEATVPPGVPKQGAPRPLEALEASGLATMAAAEPHGPGRPEHVYSLTQAAGDHFPDGHRELTGELVDFRSSEQLREFFERRAARLEAEYAPRLAGPYLSTKVRQLARSPPPARPTA